MDTLVQQVKVIVAASVEVASAEASAEASVEVASVEVAEAAASAAGAELHIFERTSGIPCGVPGVMLIAQFLDRK